MRSSTRARLLGFVAVVFLGLLSYLLTVNVVRAVDVFQREISANQVQFKAPATEADFVLLAYGQLKANFYDSKKLDSATLFNASLAGLARYLEAVGGVSFSPRKIAPGTDEALARSEFKTEFGKAEVLAGAIVPKLESHMLAFVASSAMLNTVDDSHTGFMDPKLREYSQRRNSGKVLFAGIGTLIRFSEDGSFYLSDVYPDMPADKAGLKRFDKLLAVDGIPVPAEFEYLVSLLRGEKCTEVIVTVERGGKRLDFTVERDDIVSPVARQEIIVAGKKRFGYLHLYSFRTPEAFQKTLESAVRMPSEEGITGHILDLRDNPGGQIVILNAILEIFLAPGRQCYFTQDETGRDMYTTRHQKQITDLPLVVLINEGSGSAAEIFSAVMMEQGRAVTVGIRTAGAVSVARQFALPYGAGMMVAIRQFFTAGGRTLEKIGVVPDIRVNLTSKDIAEGRDSQLERAIQILELQTKN